MGIQAISSSMAVDMTTVARSQTSSDAAAADKTSQAAAAAATQKAAGKPPAPPAGGGTKPVASTDSTNSTSSSAKIYDKRDTNQDGTVSYQEQMLYSIKYPAAETQPQNPAAVSTSQLQLGLNAYQQGQQANSTSLSSLMLAI